MEDFRYGASQIRFYFGATGKGEHVLCRPNVATRIAAYLLMIPNRRFPDYHPCGGIADLRSEKIRSQVDKTFAAVVATAGSD